MIHARIYYICIHLNGYKFACIPFLKMVWNAKSKMSTGNNKTVCANFKCRKPARELRKAFILSSQYTSHGSAQWNKPWPMCACVHIYMFRFVAVRRVQCEWNQAWMGAGVFCWFLSCLKQQHVTANSQLWSTYNIPTHGYNKLCAFIYIVHVYKYKYIEMFTTHNHYILRSNRPRFHYFALYQIGIYRVYNVLL